jgi:arylsulfatase A-like enzyme
MQTRFFLLLFLSVLLCSGCSQKTNEPKAGPQSRPNVLLIVFEDMSARVGAYGDKVAVTPVLDAFAEQALSFDSVFTTAGVCAPSRSSLITGRYQQAIGAQHMRAGEGGPIPYQAVPPSDVKAFPERLRALGYYTTNSGGYPHAPAKTDYQFGTPFTVWDEHTASHPWRGRDDGQPFFAMVNIMGTHESQTWPLDAEAHHPLVPRIIPALAASRQTRATIVKPEDVEVPPYLVDTPETRQDIAQQYENIYYQEKQIIELLDQLEEDGLSDSTIVIITTDHGDGLPRMKRSLYDAGLHVPFMVRFPDGKNAGQRRDDLVSFVDVAPTLIALAGGEVPESLPGRIFLGASTEPAPEYIYAAMDRHDEVPDRLRAARDRRWKYIRNYQPQNAFFRALAFRDVQPAMQALWQGHREGELNDIQSQYFEAPRPSEELYDTQSDPHEVINLAASPDQTDTLERLREALDSYMDRVADLSSSSEQSMVETMWPGGKQPTTAAPSISRKGSTITIDNPDPAASIGWRTTDSDKWQLYTGPFQISASTTIEAKAIRYGYKESALSTLAFIAE